MSDNCLIHNNSLLKPKDFIDSILSSDPKDPILTCNLEESSDFYYININSFHNGKHLLEISYKYNFLTLAVMLNNASNDLLFKRIFYLPEIDLEHILLHDLKDSIKLIISKII